MCTFKMEENAETCNLHFELMPKYGQLNNGPRPPSPVNGADRPPRPPRPENGPIRPSSPEKPPSPETGVGIGSKIFIVGGGLQPF